MVRTLRLVPLAAVAIAAVPAEAAPAADPPAAAPSRARPLPDVRIVGETLTGETRELPLASLALADPRELGLIVLHVEAPEPAASDLEPGETAEVVLANGRRLRGRMAGGSGETLVLELVGGVRLPVDVGSLRSVVFPERVPESLATPVAAPAEGDRVYRRTASSLDPIDGALAGFTDQGLEFESVRLGRQRFPWGEVAALFVEVLDPGRTPAAEEEGAPVVVDLVDGSRLRGALRLLDARGLALSLGGESEVLLPLETLAEIALDDGSIAYLSDLPAAREEGRGSPFGDDVGMTWPHRRDRSVTGGPLRADGKVHARGIGAHAPTRIVWELDGSWSTLRGLVAVDDEVLRLPARGSVTFRVEVDGETRWESAVLRGGDPPVAFPPIDLRGARELALVADPADEGFAGDRADWLRMLLAR